MIKLILVIGIFLAAVTFGLSRYLQINDLKGCENPEIRACSQVGAIVAISGGDTNARTDQAVALYKSGWSDRLIFSGAALDPSAPSNAITMRERAVQAGVPRAAILIDENAKNTTENAMNVEAILAARQINSIVLVTSGYHQRRASLEFERHAKDIEIYNYSAKSDKDWSGWWWLTPKGWWLAISEFFKVIASSVGGSVE